MVANELCQYRVLFNSDPFTDFIAIFAKRSEKVQVRMAIKNVELMHDCSPEHLVMQGNSKN